MASINTLLELFAANPTLANAKKITAKVTHHPMSECLVLADGIAQIRKAKQIVADAKDPKKIREAMQTELRARFPGMNIEVI
jgi:ABC-type multidrug transport system ATPase subunit